MLTLIQTDRGKLEDEEYEENYGIVWCPIYPQATQPSWGRGAYHAPLGCCCTTSNAEHNVNATHDDVCVESLENLLTFWVVAAMWTATCCYQPCRCGRPSTPCSEQMVSRHYVKSFPELLTRGPALERYALGQPV